MCVASCGEGDAADADLVEGGGQGDGGTQEQRRHFGWGVPAMLHRLGVFTCNRIIHVRDSWKRNTQEERRMYTGEGNRVHDLFLWCVCVW